MSGGNCERHPGQLGRTCYHCLKAEVHQLKVQLQELCESLEGLHGHHRHRPQDDDSGGRR